MKKTKRRFFIYFVLLIGIITFLGFSCFNTIQKIHDNKRRAEELSKEYAALVDKEEDLTNTVTRLQDPEYIAKYAREKYLYSKSGELIIDMTDSEE